MEKEHFNIYANTLVHLTLSLIIENENRYIIDYTDINRFWKTLEKNLEKQNIEAIKIWDRVYDYDSSGYPVEVYKEDSTYDEYFILYPWTDLKEFVQSFVGSIPLDIINACYQDSLFQSLPSRTDEDLEKMNQIYQKYLEEKEAENQKQYDFYNHRRKQIIKQKNRINQNRH